MRPLGGTATGMNADVIPAELRRRRQWVVWRYELVPGREKPTKVPYQVNGRKASSTDPATWTTFERANAAAPAFDGVGFAFSETDPYFGLDLDDKLTEAEAAWVVSNVDSYTERSVSGDGFHVIGRGRLSGGGKHPPKLGVFDCERYFVVTGDLVPGTRSTIEDRQVELESVLARFAPPAVVHQPRVQEAATGDDEELLRRMFVARNGATVERLWRGDISGHSSHSEADLALCGHLAWWAGGDTGRIDALFRRSGLMRDKWDERRGDSTYGAKTIARSLADRPLGLESFRGAEQLARVDRARRPW